MSELPHRLAAQIAVAPVLDLGDIPLWAIHQQAEFCLCQSGRLGANLRRLRQQAKLTQEILAERAAVQQADISKWEKGKVTPELVSALRLARALDVSLDALLQGVDAQYDAAIDRIRHGRGENLDQGAAPADAETHFAVPASAKEGIKDRTNPQRGNQDGRRTVSFTTELDALIDAFELVSHRAVALAGHLAELRGSDPGTRAHETAARLNAPALDRHVPEQQRRVKRKRQ